MGIHQHRSRKLRKIIIKTPGGKLNKVYKRRKPSSAKCANCKKPLNAVPKDLPYKVRSLTKSKRRPERPYGGFLCHKCLKEVIIKKIRNQEGKE